MRATLSPPWPPSLREGGELAQDVTNALQESIGPMQCILVPETEDHDATFLEECVAKAVTPLSAVVRRAIDFDGELAGNTEEISEVRADRKLASEPQAIALAPS